VSPSGRITTKTPTYTWNAVSGATSYYLWVNDRSGNKIATWYTADSVGCASQSGTCSIKPSTVLATGQHIFGVRTKNSSGTGSWGRGKSFFVSSSSSVKESK
jgi:hypothetical protein